MKDIKQPIYFIQVSALYTNESNENITSNGLNAFLDPMKTSKDDLIEISKDMWEQLQSDSADTFPYTSDYLTTISILENDDMKILYSTSKEDTKVSKIDKVLDTIPRPKQSELDYNCYRDEVQYLTDTHYSGESYNNPAHSQEDESIDEITVNTLT